MNDQGGPIQNMQNSQDANVLHWIIVYWRLPKAGSKANTPESILNILETRQTIPQ